jgi:hypothetical protein
MCQIIASGINCVHIRLNFHNFIKYEPYKYNVNYNRNKFYIKYQFFVISKEIHVWDFHGSKDSYCGPPDLRHHVIW